MKFECKRSITILSPFIKFSAHDLYGISCCASCFDMDITSVYDKVVSKKRI